MMDWRSLAAFAILISGIYGQDECYVFAPEDVITKDVAIVGGGGSGTYAAVRLREDLNQSIVLVEAQDHLVTFILVIVKHQLIPTRAVMSTRMSTRSATNQ